MSKSIEERFEESFKYGGNSQYLDQLYEDYIKNPEKLTPEWRKYFDSIQNGQTDISHNSVQESFKNLKLNPLTKKTLIETNTSKSSDVQNLINAYRRRGHQVANIDPLYLREKKAIPDLELEYHGLSKNDLDNELSISNFQDSKKIKLRDIIKSLQSTYTSSIGYEFMHIMNSKIRSWFLKKIEGKDTPYEFNDSEKQHILKRLVDCATENSIETIVRITADCPLIDPKLIDHCLKIHFKKKLDYTANTLNLSFPDGQDIEIISYNALLKSEKKSKNSYNQEHVTPYIRKSKIFKKYNYKSKVDYSNRRWTLDNYEDFLFLKKVIKFFSPNLFFSWKDLIKSEKYDKSLIYIKER